MEHAVSGIVLPSTIKTIRSKAFKGCSSLKEIELPMGVTAIESQAFGGCTGLNAIVVRDSVPATLGSSAFHTHSGLKIYVPQPRVNDYKQRWSEYADYIVGDNDYKTNKVVTVTAVGQLASKLGLSVTKDGNKVRYLNGPYAKYDSLTVIGPLNGDDLGVIRHLAGADAYDSDPTDGCLRYLNLWEACIKKDTENSYNGNGVDEKIGEDDIVPDYLFENCRAIETVILPKTATKIGQDIFEDATALKRVCVGSFTEKYGTDILQNLSGIEELVLPTYYHATNKSFYNDPWEAPIQQVWTTPSQLGNYMGDLALTRQAQSIAAPFAEDDVMWCLAYKGHFFPSEYLQLDNVEGIFSSEYPDADAPGVGVIRTNAIKHFDDFCLFQNVKKLQRTFSGAFMLHTITLPYSIEEIGTNAFYGCTALDTIRISCDSVPLLGTNAFQSLPSDFKILVPKNLCKLYRTKWPQYASHINPDNTHADDGIITITVTEANTVAKKLGLTVGLGDVSLVWSGKWVNSLKGDYSNIRGLKIIGPISGGDFDVLRCLAGFTPWANTRNYLGHLEYIDLYDAKIVTSDVHVRGRYKNKHVMYLGEEKDENNKVDDNTLPRHAFLRAYNLKTLILPRTCTAVKERALQECEGLETIVIGDDCEDFNWNALDDDAMLTRMYILAKKKVNISTQNAIWRALCNNYNPTFDAFYVRPSLYNDYLYDDAYTGSSWQRTNNVSKGAFEDDESFAAFAAHAAATLDDLSQVYSVKGWFDQHTGVKDLTALGYTAVDSLHATDMQKLTKLERVALPVTLEGIEDGVFTQAPNLRYVDMLMCDSTMVADDIKARGLAKLGIDTLQTLVYLPQDYGEAKGVNIVVASGGSPAGTIGLRAETFRLVDSKDYCVPYAFHADKVENTRSLPMRSTPYTLCLPYEIDKPDNTRVYALSDRDGASLVFHEIPADAKIEALKPYLIKVNTNKRRRTTTPASLNATDVQVPNSPVYGVQDDAFGYSVRGTLATVSNSEAVALGAYVLQTDGDWHPVSSSTDAAKQVAIPPYRVYMLPGASNARAQISMQLKDVDGVEEIITADNDGTTRIYDLNGRELPTQPRHGIFIQNGKKHINK